MGVFRKSSGVSPSATLGIAGTPAGADLIEVVAQTLWNTVPLAGSQVYREEAITVPAVSSARNLLVSVIAPVPMLALKDGVAIPIQPTWLYRSDSLVSPYSRMAWTIDDLIFYGNSLWVVSRGTDGAILDAEWVPRTDWTITNGRILIDEQPVDASQVLYFDSPFEGLLTVGQRKLREALNVETQIASKVSNPIPLTIISQTDDTERSKAEVAVILNNYRTQRRDPEGAVAYIPSGFTVETHGESDPALFEAERNALIRDISQYLNIPAYMLDGSLNTSFTYNTAEGTRDRFQAESLPFWTNAITARLSQDDCVPRGTSVAFNFADYYAATPSPTGPALED